MASNAMASPSRRYSQRRVDTSRPKPPSNTNAAAISSAMRPGNRPDWRASGSSNRWSMPRSTDPTYSASVVRPMPTTTSDSAGPMRDRTHPEPWLSSSALPDRKKPIAALAFMERCPDTTVVSSRTSHHQPTSTASANTIISTAITRENPMNLRTTLASRWNGTAIMVATLAGKCATVNASRDNRWRNETTGTRSAAAIRLAPIKLDWSPPLAPAGFVAAACAARCCRAPRSDGTTPPPRAGRSGSSRSCRWFRGSP